MNMIFKCDNFNLDDTFECGQCFRWNKDDNGVYTGIVEGNVLRLKQTGDSIDFDGDIAFWKNYFDLDTDYNEIIRKIRIDDVMKNATEKGKGIRILRQNLFETVISFIISQNNNIPRIKGIVEKLCMGFGNKIDGLNYSFPTPESLNSADITDFAYLKAGYRDVYIKDAARFFTEHILDSDILINGNLSDARSEISKIKGVGPKVADCILLFGAYRTEVFPTDVWMKRILSIYYGINNASPAEINAFASKKFGKYAGFAQQYLFYLARSEKIGM